jgi:tetratricopeptide (TPR) repeat protein
MSSFLLRTAWLTIVLGCVIPFGQAHCAQDEISESDQEQTASTIKNVRQILETYPLLSDKKTILADIDTYLNYFPRSRYLGRLQYLAADVLFSAGEFEKALPRYAAVAELDSSLFNESALYRFGQCHFNLKHYDEAIRAWEKLVKRASPFLYPEALTALGQAFVKIQDWDTAQQVFARLFEDQPQYRERPDIRLAMGIASYHRGQYFEVLLWLKDILQPEAYLYQARALFKMGQPEKAIAWYNRLWEDFSAPTLAHAAAGYEKGGIFLARRQYDLARADLEQILLRFPDIPLTPFVTYRLAVVDFFQNRLEQAKSNLEKMRQMALSPGMRRQTTFLYSEYLARRGRFQEAIALFDGLASQGGSDAKSEEVLLRKMGFLLKLGNFDATEKLLNEYLGRFPKSKNALAVAFIRGNLYYARNQFQRAIDLYTEAIFNNPLSYITDACLDQIQRAYLKQAQFEKMISHSVPILQMLEKQYQPENEEYRAEAYFNLGEAYFRLGRYAAAIGKFRKVLDQFGMTAVNPLAYESIAWCYFKSHDYRQAEVSVREALKNSGLNRRMQKRLELLLCHALFNQRAYALAAEGYEKWAETSEIPGLVPEALLGLAEAYYRSDQGAAATAALQKIIRDYPRHPMAAEALLKLGYYYFNAQEYEQALSVYSEFLKNYAGDEREAETFLRLGHALYNAGRVAEAKKKYEEFIRRWPDDRLTKEARMGMELTDWRDAERLRTRDNYQGFMRRYPQSQFSALALYRIGVVAYEGHAYEQAIKDFEQLIYEYPGSAQVPYARYYIGMTFEKKKEFQAAVDVYQAFKRNYPNHDLMPEIKTKLGEAYFFQQDYAQAIHVFKSVIKDYPLPEYMAGAQYNLGVCYEKSGRKVEAVQEYKTFLKLYPGHEKQDEVILHIAHLYDEAQKYDLNIAFLGPYAKQAKGKARQEMLYLLGIAYEAAGAQPAAIAAWEMARAGDDPQDNFRMLCMAKLGAGYERQGKIAQALAVYQDIEAHAQDQAWRENARRRIAALAR